MSRPNITSIAPDTAPSGTFVTINGSGFTGAGDGGAVNFGGTGTTNFTVISDTEITAQVPLLTSGTVGVSVIVPNEVGSNSYDFTIPAPSATVNTINIVNNTALDPTVYSVWVAGYIETNNSPATFTFLQSDGSFSTADSDATFFLLDLGQSMSIHVPNITNYGNNRLVFTVTDVNTTPSALSPITGYTAYPFETAPGVCPPGPYDIFEFGPNAQYDVSAVDSFGLNISFTVEGDPLTYGPLPWIARPQIGKAYADFIAKENHPAGFAQLLYKSPTGSGYPDQIEGQFSAIVSPKDWLAIYPTADGLSTHWDDTVNDFFADGNQINFYLNGATIGTYSGSSNGEEYTLSGPDGSTVVVPKSDFTGTQPFTQAVPASYDATLGQIEAAFFQAFSRGVALDGVVAAGKTITANYTSDAWTNYGNWYTSHANAYNGKPSVYDCYAKFFHMAKYGNVTIFGSNSNEAYGMAYGFSLDENPNVGSDALGIPTNAWPNGLNTPAKTPYDVYSQTVTVTLGAWNIIA